MILKKQRGITLVTLVITIVVMLIIAGASINIAIDSNGIIAKAKEAKFKANMAILKEEIDLKRTKLHTEENYTEENLIQEIENSKTLKNFDYKISGNLLIIEEEVISLIGEPIEEGVASEWYYQIYDNTEAWIYGYKGTKTDITIPSYIKEQGTIYPVTRLSQSWTEENFQNDTSITSVKILSNIKEIEAWVFNGCTALKSVYMTDGVTKMGDGVFNNCPALKEVRLSNNIGELGTSVFANSQALENCIIPNKLTTIPESTFNQCKSLKSITIPSSITTIGPNAFMWCASLEIIDIPSSVVEIGNLAFGYVGNIGDTYMGAEWRGKLKQIILREGLQTIGEEAFVCAQTVIENLQKPSTVTSVGTNAFLNFGTEGGGQLIGWD